MNYSAESSNSNLKVFEKAAAAAAPPSPGSIDSPSRLSKVSLRGRIHHITWSSFSCTMATGGLTLLISEQPHTFRGLSVLGNIVFILDLFIFCVFSAGITARFIMFPGTLKSSLAHPAESLSFATFWLSIATIINNMQKHGVPHCGEWLITTIRVLFWIYCAGSFLVAVITYYQLFTTKRHMDLHNITPSWMLPIFPIMLSGTIASTIAKDQPIAQSLNILVAGLTFQGLGLMVATLMYAQYIARLITRGLPDPNARPGMFIAVGPPSFTALAIVGMAQASVRVFPAYGTINGISKPELISDYLQVIAIVMAVFLWSVAFWFFCLSLIAVLQGVKHMTFHLGWWGLIFPNVGFTIATIKIGEVLGSEVVLWVGSVCTVLLGGLWVFVAFSHGKAIWDREIMWPGKDEDHDR